MKALTLDENTEAVVIVEKGDRFISLSEDQSAIILEEADDGSGNAKITSVFPLGIEDSEEIPFSVSLAACIRVFLDDPDWVQEAHRRIEETTKNKA